MTNQPIEQRIAHFDFEIEKTFDAPTPQFFQPLGVQPVKGGVMLKAQCGGEATVHRSFRLTTKAEDRKPDEKYIGRFLVPIHWYEVQPPQDTKKQEPAKK